MLASHSDFESEPRRFDPYPGSRTELGESMFETEKSLENKIQKLEKDITDYKSKMSSKDPAVRETYRMLISIAEKELVKAKGRLHIIKAKNAIKARERANKKKK